MNYKRFFSLEVTLFRILFQLTLLVAFKFEDISNYQDVIGNFVGTIVGCIVAEIIVRSIYRYFFK